MSTLKRLAFHLYSLMHASEVSHVICAGKFAQFSTIVCLPSAFSITLGLPDSMTATHELVVPRSIPTMLNKKNQKVSVSSLNHLGESPAPRCAYCDLSGRSCTSGGQGKCSLFTRSYGRSAKGVSGLECFSGFSKV